MAQDVSQEEVEDIEEIEAENVKARNATELKKLAACI